MAHENGKKKAYSIQYPSTTQDDGSPSDDPLHDCRRVLLLIEDERHLTAQKLYSSVIVRLENHPGGNPEQLKSLRRQGVLKRRQMKKLTAFQDEEYLALRQFLESHCQTLSTLEVSDQGCLSYNMNSTVHGMQETHTLSYASDEGCFVQTSTDHVANERSVDSFADFIWYNDIL